MPVPPSLSELRQLLAARFPTSPRRAAALVPTGIPALDDALTGGLPAAAFTELVCPHASSGGGLVLLSLLQQTRAARQRVALLDATDSFAPDEIAPELLEHLVWARGQPANLKAFWAAADLLVRDPHFTLVVFDFRGLPARELLRTPATTWYRLQRALEQSAAAALVLSPADAVPCAAHRFRLADPLAAPAFAAERTTLAASLLPDHARQRAAHSLSA